MAETLTALEVELSPKGLVEVTNALLAVNKEQQKATKSAVMYGAASLAAIGGIIRSSPIAQSYMAELSAITGVFADTILTGLMPVIDPLLEFLWKGAEAFENLEGPAKTGAIAIGGVIAALWLLNAHPVVLAISGIVLALYLLEEKFGAVSWLGEKVLLPMFTAVGDAINWVSDALTGHSLVPDLEILEKVIRTALMPQLMAFEIGMQGITRAVEIGGDIVNKTFNMINNFSFSGIMDAIDGVTRGIDSVTGAASKVKGWLSF